MRALIVVAALLGACFPPTPAEAQSGDDLMVVIVDPGPVRLNQTSLLRAIGAEVERTIVRMTDERAPEAAGRLTIAFSRPDRWVLRYESGGQVAWVSDNIRRPGELRARLASLSRDVVGRVDGARPGAARPTPPRARGTWNDDVILALQNEILDPFEDEPRHRSARRPITVLWSEVVDPFNDRSPRATVGEVWSEVLDPWSTEVRRRR